MLFSQFYPSSTGLSKGGEVNPPCLRGNFEEEFSLNINPSKALEAEDISGGVCLSQSQSTGNHYLGLVADCSSGGAWQSLAPLALLDLCCWGVEGSLGLN